MAEEIKKTKKGNFIEILFTGYHDGKIFDSNILSDLKQISEKADAQKTIVIIGEGMVVPGLDSALENKEIEKEYNIDIPYREGLCERRRELVKTIPLKVFTKQKINTFPGQTFLLDNMLVRIITVSGARVVTDFNTTLAGKDITYKFIIKRFVTDTKEKAKVFLKHFARVQPELEVKENKVIIEGPESMKQPIEMFKNRFKELVGADLEFRLEKNPAGKKGEPEEKASAQQSL